MSTHTSSCQTRQRKKRPKPAIRDGFSPEQVKNLSQRAESRCWRMSSRSIIKTKNFHWHMSGPHFRDYHLLLDEQADQIFKITDDIAERVRKIGGDVAANPHAANLRQDTFALDLHAGGPAVHGQGDYRRASAAISSPSLPTSLPRHLIELGRRQPGAWWRACATAR